MAYSSYHFVFLVHVPDKIQGFLAHPYLVRSPASRNDNSIKIISIISFYIAVNLYGGVKLAIILFFPNTCNYNLITFFSKPVFGIKNFSIMVFWADNHQNSFWHCINCLFLTII